VCSADTRLLIVVEGLYAVGGIELGVCRSAGLVVGGNSKNISVLTHGQADQIIRQLGKLVEGGVLLGGDDWLQSAG